MRIGDFSPLKQEIASEGVKIGHFGTYSLPKLTRHWDVVKEMSHAMKNLGRSKIRPISSEEVALSSYAIEKLRKAYQKGEPEKNDR